MEISNLPRLQQAVISPSRVPAQHQSRAIGEFRGRNRMRRNVNDFETIERLGLESSLGCISSQKKDARSAEDLPGSFDLVQRAGQIWQGITVKLKGIRNQTGRPSSCRSLRRET